MCTLQADSPPRRPGRMLIWWLAGALVLVAALWAGPGAWAQSIGACGQGGTVPSPCGVDDGAGTAYETAVTIPVLANDQDKLGLGMSVASVTTPANGSVVINRAAGVPNTVTYTPKPGYSGSDLFAYDVTSVLTGGLVVTGTAQVVVQVAQPGEPPPVVEPINPNVDNTGQFSQSVVLPNGESAPVTTTVDIPSGTFTFTVRPTDTLSVVFTPVLTPTGPINQPPVSALQGAAATAGAYKYTNLTFLLDVLLNNQTIGLVGLGKPATLTVKYPGAFLAGMDENTLSPYYWNGSAWSTDGLVVSARNPAEDRIVFTLDRLVGQITFFARLSTQYIYIPLAARN